MALSLPPIGLGIVVRGPEGCAATVAAALETGYRHVDTTRPYDEGSVGEGTDPEDGPS